jgi:hypothetical protein
MCYVAGRRARQAGRAGRCYVSASGQAGRADRCVSRQAGRNQVSCVSRQAGHMVKMWEEV